MKAVELQLPIAWSGQAHEISGSSIKVDILPKSAYRELVRVYNARFFELFTLIKNESQVLKRNGDVVLWYLSGKTDAGFVVYYAMIQSTSVVLPAAGFRFLIPESWLLCHLLGDDILYRINASEVFWAYRPHGKSLRLVAARGLYENAGVFCTASGMTNVPEAKEYDLHQYIENGKRPIPLLMLAGAWFNAKKERQFDFAAFVPYLKKLAVILSSYTVALSVALIGAESYFSSKVDELSADAAVFMEKQQGLAQKQEFIGAYQQLISAHSKNVVMLRSVTKMPESLGKLQVIQTAAARVQLQGTAKSATSVLGFFVNNPHFSEVKFDREVQTIRGEESYSISMVYTDKGLSGTGGDADAAGQ